MLERDASQASAPTATKSTITKKTFFGLALALVISVLGLLISAFHIGGNEKVDDSFMIITKMQERIS